MMIIRRFFPLMILLVFSATSIGCAGNFIRGDELYPDDPHFSIDEQAQIEDTTDARQLLDVLFQYRRALVSKDFGTLLRLVSDDYYDNAGTTHTTADDYGRDELDEHFELLANYAQQIRYRIVVKDVQIDGGRAHIDYEFEYAFQYRIGDHETWDAGVDVNRVEFLREGERWRISSGM